MFCFIIEKSTKEQSMFDIELKYGHQTNLEKLKTNTAF